VSDKFRLGFEGNDLALITHEPAHPVRIDALIGTGIDHRFAVDVA
jgi:hypothetical protein